MAAFALLPASAPGSPETPVLDPVLRRVRWVATAVAVAALAVSPDPASGSRIDPLVAAVLVVAGGVALNLLSRRRPAALAQLAGDATVVLVMTAALAADRDGPYWVLLALPVLEGAVRWHLRGALATLAAVGPAWVLVERWAGSAYGQPMAGGSYLYRLAVLATVAVAAGEAARLGAAQVARQRAAEQAARRAALLGVTAAAGPAIASLEPDRILASVVDAVVALGFDAVHISVLHDDGRTWRVAHASDSRRALVGGRHRADDGLAGEVLRVRGSVVAGDASGTPEARGWLEAAGCRAAVATPVFVQRELVAVLEAGRRIDRPLTADELECIELLAEQAGSALANARRFHVERAGVPTMYDERTGLPTRLLLADRLEHALAASARTGSLVAVAELEVAADGDGDAVLAVIARRLAAAVRPADTVAVAGGHRLALLAGAIVGLDDVVRLMDRVMAEVRRPLLAGSEVPRVTVSAGVALGRSASVSSEHLLRQAELALRRARETGGDRYEVFNAPVHLRLSEAGELHDTLRRVVERW